MQVFTPPTREGIIPSAFHVTDELNAVVHARVCGVLPIVALIYLSLSAMAVLSSGGMKAGPSLYTSFLTGLLSLGTWAIVRRQVKPGAWIHAVMGGVALAVIADGLVSLYIFNDPNAASILFLLFVVSGLTVVSVVLQGMIVAVALTGWFLTASMVLPSYDFWYWSLVLLSTAVLSVLNVRYRTWKQGRKAVAAPVQELFQRDYLEKAVEGTQDGLWYWELKTDVFHFSAAWAELLGFEPSELTKHPDEWMNRVHPGYVARLRAELKAHLYGEEPQFRNEHRMRRKDGTYMWVLARGTVARNADGEPIVLAGSHSDITPLIEVEKRLLTDTFKDALTGLANRSFLTSHLQMAVEEKAARGTSAPLFAVMFLDLDRFKWINDTMGHPVGDELLRAVAGRLRNCARPDDVVARFGGDEFVVLLRGLRDAEEAMGVGSRMLKALMTPFHLGDKEIQSGGSIGIALSREQFQTADEILNFGDVAMYHSKKNGKGRVTLFRPDMLEESNKQDALQSELEQAVERGQLVLHYQPSIHMATGRIVGAEALIRWKRANGDLLYPAEFLPQAEKSELIQQIGEWALRTACAQNKAWQEAGVAPLRMSVNLSARQLHQADLPAMVNRILSETKLQPDWLELEMSEASLMRNPEQAAGMLKALGDSGIRTAIDNFGTGTSSLSSLRQLPFQTVKLDRAFVSEITTDRRTAAVASGLITMAHHLGLSVVAEGVEQNEQARFLLAERCDNAQGYLMGRPVPGEELGALLRPSVEAPRIHTPGTVSTGPVTLEKDLSALKAAVPSQALSWAAQRKAREPR